MREFEVLGHTYSVGRISARDQFHLVRRIVPAFTGLMSVAEIMKTARGGAAGLLTSLGPFTEALGKMSDADADYVIDTCLRAVKRRIEGDRGWASVGASEALMFDDIGLAVMLRLVFEAGRENLEGFFAALRQMFPGVLEQTTASDT